MNPITIPRSKINDDLVIITRSEYTSLLNLAKNEDEELNELEESISQARKDETFGPFNSVDELIGSLKS